MRDLLSAFFAFAIAACAAEAAAQANLIGERDIARPGGVYTSLTAPDALACARACTEDGICLAWTLRDGVCELKAIVPAPVAQTGAVSGLSSRAPEFSRRMALQVPSAPHQETTPEHQTASLLGGLSAGDLRPRLGEND